MRRIIGAVLGVLVAGNAYAACPITPSNCPSSTFNSISIVAQNTGASSSTLFVGGATTLASTLAVTGASTFGSTVATTGKLTLSGGLQLNTGGSFSAGNLTRDANWGWWQQAASGAVADMALVSSAGTVALSFPSSGAVTIPQGSRSGGGTVTWSGTALLPPNLTLMSGGAWTGTIPNGQSTMPGGGVPLNWVGIGTDNLAVGTSGVGTVNYFAITSNTIGASATGNRTAMQITLAQTVLSGDKAAGLAQANYLGVGAGVSASANNGGTAQTSANAYSSVFGAGIGALLGTNATWFRDLVGAEIDITSGVTDQTKAPLRKVGIQIVSYQDGAIVDSSNGAAIDAMLLLGRFDNAVGFYNGVQFGSANSHNPINTSGKMIASEIGLHNTGSPPPIKSVAYGVDFLQSAFSSMAWRSPGFSVNGSGTAQVGSATISAGNGIAIDAAGSVYSSLAIAAGGSGFSTNNLVFDDPRGGIFYADTVVAGAVTSLTVLVAPTITGAAPSNPVTLTVPRGATGTGLTVNYTWSAKKTVDVGVTGATAVNVGNASAVTRLGSATALATNATTGIITVPATTGAPSGTVGSTDSVAMIYRTDTNKPCWSKGGGTWRDATGGAC